MKTRFIQQHRIGEIVYLPGMSADHLPDKLLKKLKREGVVAEKAAPEVAKKEVSDAEID